MKQSHKKILDLLKSGHWFKRNQYSFKTLDVMHGLKWTGTVRQSTIDEMMKDGLLKIGIVGNMTAYIPGEKS